MTSLAFKPGDWVVYPAHGVGNITAIEKLCVANTPLEYYVIVWTGKDAWKIMVPVDKANPLGLRSLAPPAVAAAALRTVHKKPKQAKSSWKKKLNECRQKVTSGDLISIAEVVRDLRYKDSERALVESNLLETAIKRLAREIALIEGVSEEDAREQIMIKGGMTNGTPPSSPKPTAPKTRQQPSRKVAEWRPKSSRDILDEIWDQPPISTEEQLVTSPTAASASPRQRVSKPKAYFGGTLMTQDQIPNGDMMKIKDGQWVPR